uniref:Uncharacterized protein n=1 Tax=Glossina austeni TaxID=7395 RepID=A0A1A9VR86_GLOAU
MNYSPRTIHILCQVFVAFYFLCIVKENFLNKTAFYKRLSKASASLRFTLFGILNVRMSPEILKQMMWHGLLKGRGAVALRQFSQLHSVLVEEPRKSIVSLSLSSNLCADNRCEETPQH